MSTTRPQHPQHQQHQQRREYRLYPQYPQGQHVRLPGGTHAHVLAQRGLTLWLRNDTDDGTVTTRRADVVAPVDSGDQISTDVRD